jgi:hypothetical protein
VHGVLRTPTVPRGAAHWIAFVTPKASHNKAQGRGACRAPWVNGARITINPEGVLQMAVVHATSHCETPLGFRASFRASFPRVRSGRATLGCDVGRLQRRLRRTHSGRIRHAEGVTQQRKQIATPFPTNPKGVYKPRPPMPQHCKTPSGFWMNVLVFVSQGALGTSDPGL